MSSPAPRRLGVALAALLAGCAAEPTLVVDLQTGITPGLEFTQVVTQLTELQPGAERDQVRRDIEVVMDVEPDDLRFLDGGRVADFVRIPAGEYWVEVFLRAPDGSVLVRQVLGPVEVFADTTRTVRITRDCIDVECPGSGPPGNLACLQGQCVDPRCSPESPEFCPPVSCELDGDCTPPGVTCADTRCRSGTCFVFASGESCPDASVCDADIGCVPLDMPPPPDCVSPVCSIGNECAIGSVACDDSEVCEPWANALSGSPCARGECDGDGGCVGFPLTVEVEGAGQVISEPAGLDCASASCTARFVRDTVVTLVAVEPPGSTFASWEGECETTDGARCYVRMSEARGVRALFEGAVHRVSVVLSGSGSGSVQGGPIDCGVACDVDVPYGTMLTLDAAPASASDTFGGWGGACAGESSTTCVVEVTEDLVIGAAFVPVGEDVLRVVRGGTGGGVVTSTPAGIDCGATCADGFVSGSTVTLEAAASPGSRFDGWGGDAPASCGTSSTCDVTVASALTSVTATFTRLRHPVTVQLVGGGTGSVRSSPAGIDCPSAACMADFDAGSMVQLTPTPGADSVFAGWELVSACGLATLCNFTVAGPTTVRARFEPAPVTLTVTRTGGGSGVVRESGTPLRIDCGSDCAETVVPPAPIVLEATPSAGSTFGGWSGTGGCAGSGNPCSTTITEDATVTARFDVATWMLDVTVTGAGSGAVVSAPAGAIDCGSDCGEVYTHGTLVTLDAVPVGGSTFAGWGGDCAGAGLATRCTVTMNAAKSVTASFSESMHTLSVSRLGTGVGAVRETAPGSSIDCGSTCSASYTAGTDVTLVATPDTCSDFVGWNVCAGVSSCTVAVSGPTAVEATFDLRLHTLTVSSVGGAEVRNRGGDPTGIACPSPGPCAGSYDCGETALLEVRCPSGARFDSWSLPSCGSSTSCDVPMVGDRTVTATCVPIEWPLDVTVTGQGEVRSSPAGIACRPGSASGCTADFPDGTVVALAATPDDGYCFTGWSLAPLCGTSPTCMVTMDMARMAEAQFEPCEGVDRCELTVSIVGVGAVDSSPLGIRCPGDCSELYSCTDSVTLLASPERDFTGWSGCTPRAAMPNVCEVRFSGGPVHVTATFGAGGG